MKAEKSAKVEKFRFQEYYKFGNVTISFPKGKKPRGIKNKSELIKLLRLKKTDLK